MALSDMPQGGLLAGPNEDGDVELHVRRLAATTGASFPFGCKTTYRAEVYVDGSTHRPAVGPLTNGSQPVTHVSRGDCIEWYINNFPNSGLWFGNLKFFTYDSDAATFPPEGGRQKKRNHCKSCGSNVYIQIPDWPCQYADSCTMPIYTDLPDGDYHYGVKALHKHGDGLWYWEKSDPDIEVSGPPGTEDEIDDVIKRLLAALHR